MCARCPTISDPELLWNYFNLLEPLDFQPTANLAPTDLSPVVIEARPEIRTARMMRWGLVPWWAKDTKIGTRMINARAGTLFEKPAFKDYIIKHRCLIPATGFYEWEHKGKLKQPFLVHL